MLIRVLKNNISLENLMPLLLNPEGDFTGTLFEKLLVSSWA